MKFLIFLLLLFLLCNCSNKTSQKKNIEYNDEIVLIDSIPWKENKTIFWYKIMDGLGTSSVSYIGIYKNACAIDTSRFLIKGDLLYEIKFLTSRKLQITSHIGYIVVNKDTSIEFIDKHFEYGKKFTRNSLLEDISLDSICH